MVHHKPANKAVKLRSMQKYEDYCAMRSAELYSPLLGLKETMRELEEKLSVNPKLKHLRLKLKQSTASRASPEV